MGGTYKLVTADGKALTYDSTANKVYLRDSQQNATNQEWWLSGIASAAGGQFTTSSSLAASRLQLPKDVPRSDLAADIPVVLQVPDYGNTEQTDVWYLVKAADNPDVVFIVSYPAPWLAIGVNGSGSDPSECVLKTLDFEDAAASFKLYQVI